MAGRWAGTWRGEVLLGMAAVAVPLALPLPATAASWAAYGGLLGCGLVLAIATPASALRLAADLVLGFFLADAAGFLIFYPHHVWTSSLGLSLTQALLFAAPAAFFGAGVGALLRQMGQAAGALRQARAASRNRAR